MKIILKITLICFSFLLINNIAKADTTDWASHTIPGLGSFKMPPGAITTDTMDLTYTFVMVDSILSLHLQVFPKTMLDTITDAGWMDALNQRPNDTLMALALTQANMTGNIITDSATFIAYGRVGLEVTMQSNPEFDWDGEITVMRFYDTGDYYLQYFINDLLPDIERFDIYREDYYSTIIVGTP